MFGDNGFTYQLLNFWESRRCKFIIYIPKGNDESELIKQLEHEQIVHEVTERSFHHV